MDNYFYKTRADEFIQTKKMLLLRKRMRGQIDKRRPRQVETSRIAVRALNMQMYLQKILL